jgi:hypothetical protein
MGLRVFDNIMRSSQLPTKDLETLFCAKPKEESASIFKRKKEFEKPKVDLI